jgi:uncharacterized protein
MDHMGSCRTQLPGVGAKRGGVLPNRTRALLFIMAEALIVFLCLPLCSSRGEAFYMAVVPGFVVYVALYRGRIARKTLRRHLAYLAVVSLAAVGGLLALARMTPNVGISAAELLITVYFLAALYILLVGGDQAARVVLARMRLRGAVLQAVRVLLLMAVGGPFVTAALATHWPKFHDTSNPQDLYDYRYEAVGFRAADGVGLAAWFIPAQTTASDTTVIVVPARGMSKTAFLPYAGMLAGDWFNVLLVDPRGEGESDGHTRGFGVIEGQDVTGAVDYLRRSRPGESRHIFALGVSEGASAALAAARADDRIEAVIADSVFPTPAAELERVMPPLPGPLAKYFEKSTLLLASIQLGCNLFESGAERDVAAIAPRPVMIIQGQDDRVVSAGQAEELYAAAGGQTLLWKVRSAGHADCLATCPATYSRTVCRTLRYVRLGMPPFYWVEKAQAAQG